MRRDLVERAMAHDHEAFSELARLSIDKLHAIARLILFDADRAQDATQEALILAWRDIAALRDPDRFEAWLRRLLVNACYREARRAKSRRIMEGAVAEIDPDVPDISRQVADRDALERGFGRLDPDQRAQRPPPGTDDMTEPGFDRRFTAWLDERVQPHAPDGLLADTLERTAHIHARPAWRIPARCSGSVPLPNRRFTAHRRSAHPGAPAQAPEKPQVSRGEGRLLTLAGWLCGGTPARTSSMSEPTA